MAQAIASSGTTVAARGAAPSPVPYGGFGPAPVAAPYRSTTPAVLFWSKVVLLALAFAWALSSALVLRATSAATTTIGRDTAPSVVLAERIRGLLADANANLATVALTDDPDGGTFMSALRQDVREAETLLVEAAQNVTYGEEEKGPIVTMARAVADFEQAVGRSRAEAGGRDRVLADAKAGDDIMHFSILPAGAALERANDAYLADAYGGHKRWALAGDVVLVAAPLLLLLVLAASQVDLFRRTRRLLNPGLALASAVVLVVGANVVWRHRVAEHALYVAKEQAFDSVYALLSARSLATDANAAQRYWLLARGDARTTAAAQFRSRQLRILDMSAAFNVTSLPRTGTVDFPRAIDAAANGRLRLKGMLGDELANLTFAGEGQAAGDAAKGWLAYLAIDAQVRSLEEAGRSGEAFALCVGTGQDQSSGAFARFLDALDRTVAINQAAFDGAVAHGEAELGFLAFGEVFAAWLLASAGIALGIHLREREYAF